MVRALDEQIRLAEMMASGERYTATAQRWEINPATGERRRVEWPRRVHAWFWQVDGAEWFVTLRYGNRCIELARGRRAAREGEFDAGLESASRTIHARFKA